MPYDPTHRITRVIVAGAMADPGTMAGRAGDTNKRSVRPLPRGDARELVTPPAGNRRAPGLKDQL